MREAAWRGAIWGLLGQGLQVVTYFAGYVLLARHLDKHELGLAAMVLVVQGVLGVGADLGMGVVLIQRRDPDERRGSRLAAAAGALCALAVLACAPALASLYGRPAGFVPLLRAGAAALLLAGVAASARARLQRALGFRRLFVVDASVELARAAARVLLAAHGLGAWSIVLGDLIALGAGTALAWLLAALPRGGRDHALAADGLRVVGTRAADACFVQADRFVVGSGIGTGALGLYSFACQHTLMALQRLTVVAEQVALPLLSRLQGERETLARAYLTLTRVFALLVVPGAALLWHGAPWLVDLLYPQRWSEAVPVLRALCVAVAAAGLNSHPGLVWIALGRLRLRLAWSVSNLGLLALVLALGLRWGMAGVAYALALRSLLATVAAQVLTRRLAGVRHADYLRALAPGLLIAAAVAALGGLADL